jgi:hypothetical protein
MMKFVPAAMRKREGAFLTNMEQVSDSRLKPTQCFCFGKMR